MTYYSDLIGIPYKIGGRGPDCYDCYGLVKEIYRKHRNIILPDYHSPQEFDKIQAMIVEHRYLWRAVDRQPDTVVLFRLDGYGCHVGYMINYRKFIHVWEKCVYGVAVEDIDKPEWRHIRAGFYEYTDGG